MSVKNDSSLVKISDIKNSYIVNNKGKKKKI